MDRVGKDRRVGRIALYVAFARAARRYWLSVFPRVLLDLRRRRRRAEQIREPLQRGLALSALAKRSNVEGAAAFAAFVPRRTRKAAVRALVAFQAIYDYTDLLAEQPSDDPIGEARRLHEALPEGLGADCDHPSGRGPGNAALGDAVYLADLVAGCREALAALPSLSVVESLAREASEQIVLFESLGAGSQGELERWARQRGVEPREGDAARLRWWEAAALTGSSLPVHALLAAAASPDLGEGDAERVRDVYSSEISALHSLLDSLVDRAEDLASGQLSLIDCYASPEEAAGRLLQLARDSVRLVGDLPEPSAHLLLVIAMACSYLDTATRTGGGDRASIDPEVLVRRMSEVLGPPAALVIFVFRLRHLAGRFAHVGDRRKHGRGPARGIATATLAPSDPEPRGADARAA